MPEFRTTILTLAGFVGYLAFLAAAALKILGYPVAWELIGLILLTSSALLGVDFGGDLFGFFGRSGPGSGGRKGG